MSVSTDNDQVLYSFDGTVGDLVSLDVVGIDPRWQPNVTLLNPSQQPVADSTNIEPLGFMTSSTQIIYRLQETGTYTIVVSGTAGSFLLTLAARPAVTTTPLVLNSPVNLSLPTAEADSVFVFNTDPTFATTLLIDADPVDLNARIEVRNGVGQVIALLHGNLDNACISFGPGDELDEMTVTGNPDTTGTLSITLSHAPCNEATASAQPAQPIPSPTATEEFVPARIPGACAASSAGSVNIRSGPGEAFEIVSILLPEQPIEVMGRNDAGDWYEVQNASIQGWILASLVETTGPCRRVLPVESPIPTISPTPTPGLLEGAAKGTLMSASATSPGNTRVSTATALPFTNTPVPPTNTPVPPTNTPVPPTNTPVPPTNTPVPPDTPVPPPDTPVPPPDTPVPPPDTPVPPDTP